MRILPFILMFALINSCIELEISAPSFPNIMNCFGVAESIVGLTITMNLIGFCVAASVYGPLSDAFGRRRVMLVGNAILAIGAVGCMMAPSVYFLLAARFVQGLGAATSAVVVSAIIADKYGAREAAKLYGLMNAVFTTLMALSPVAGGFINQMVGWRGNYGVVALICVISWILLAILLPETNKKPQKLKFRKVVRDYKVLFSSSIFLCAASVPSMLYACYMAFIAISPFIYTQIFQLSMFHYTLSIALVIATFALTSSVSGKIAGYFGVRKSLTLALGLQMMGPLLMCFANTALSVTISMSLFSIGFALIYPIIFAQSMEIFPEMKGTASSAIMSLRYLICASLTAIASFAYDDTVASLSVVLLIVGLLIAAFSANLIKRELFATSSF